MKIISAANPRQRQEELGQLLTTAPETDFMASMFGPFLQTVRLLDATVGDNGAGLISLAQTP